MNFSGYRKIEYAINKRSNKERWILLFIGIGLIFLLWNNLFYKKIVIEKAKVIAQIKETQSGLKDTKEKLNVLLEDIKKDPTKDLRAQRDRLAEEVGVVNQELTLVMDNLVDPQEMLILLKSIIEEQSSLTLLRIENKSPTLVKVVEHAVAKEPVKATKNKEGEKSSEEVQPASKLNITLYKHTLEMTFSGTFFKVLDYLKKLEGGNKKIIWDSLTYVVTDYPIAEVKLIVMTISTHEGWLGV